MRISILSRSHRAALSFAAIQLAALATVTQDANAFCRQRTCQDRPPESPKGAYYCKRGEDGCISEGEFLYRPTPCFSFGVEAETAASLQLTDSEFDDIIKEAFHQWETADCGGGRTPRIVVQSVGAVLSHGKFTCQSVRSANLGVWMFVTNWNQEHDASALGFTSSRFDSQVDVGEVVDSDVELNLEHLTKNFDTLDERRRALLTIATHEAGHFLGLSHAQDIHPFAVMAPRADDFSLVQGKELTDDDIEGICTLYPPEKSKLTCSEAGYLEAALSKEQCDTLAAERSNGQAESSCSVGHLGTPTRPENRGTPLALAAGLAGLVLSRRRR